MPLRTGPSEAHRQQDEVCVDRKLGTSNGLELRRGPTSIPCKLLHISIASPVNFVVAILHSRMPPSSCAPSTRSCIGHSGHGVCGDRFAGGIGMISN